MICSICLEEKQHMAWGLTCNGVNEYICLECDRKGAEYIKLLAKMINKIRVERPEVTDPNSNKSIAVYNNHSSVGIHINNNTEE